MSTDKDSWYVIGIRAGKWVCLCSHNKYDNGKEGAERCARGWRQNGGYNDEQHLEALVVPAATITTTLMILNKVTS